MVSRTCEHCSKVFAHRQSLFRHKKNCKSKHILLEAIQKNHDTPAEIINGSQDRDDITVERCKNVQLQRKVGCALDPEEFLDSLPVSRSTSMDEVSGLSKKVNDKDKMDNLPMDHNKRFFDQLEKDTNEKIELFKDVTLMDKNKFMDLFAEVKSQTPDHDFKRLDELTSEYFNGNVYEDNRGETIAEKIYSKLDGFGYDTMKAKLTKIKLQMILRFMEIKRNSINVLLDILKSEDREELWRNTARGVITDEEARRLEKDITKENIKKTIMDRDIDDWIK